jgi:5-methylcytosine-specific restriction protein A
MRRGRPRLSKFRWRNPPLPSWFNTTAWGVCRWCNQPIYKKGTKTVNKRRRFHEECLHPYWIVSDHKYAKRSVKSRDKGICAGCGKYCHYRWQWNLDHIVPLADAPRVLDSFGLGNMQTLCCKCHDKKTAKENVARKKKRLARPRRITKIAKRKKRRS